MSQYAKPNSQDEIDFATGKDEFEPAAVALSPLAASGKSVALVAADQQALEQHAENLVADLFREVEEILATEPHKVTSQVRRSAAQVLPIQRLSHLLKTAESEGARTEPVSSRDRSSALVPWRSPHALAIRQPASLASQAGAVAELRHLRRRRSLDGLMLGAGGMSLMLSLAGWIATQNGWLHLYSTEVTAIAQPTRPVSEPFFEYLRQSLDRLDNEPATTTASPTPSLLSAIPDLPSPAAQPDQKSNQKSRTPKAAVTIAKLAPVAPKVAKSSPPLAVVAARANRPLPQIPVPALPPVMQLPPPPPLAPPTALAKPKPAAPVAAPSPLPNVNPAPLPTTTSPPATPQPVAVVPSPADSALQYVLTGVMEMGNQSAALVEVGGVTLRIQVGEMMGSSGWRLISIGNQEAVIQRNQQTQTIPVGGRF